MPGQPRPPAPRGCSSIPRLASPAGIACRLAQGRGLAGDIEPAADPRPGAGQRRARADPAAGTAGLQDDHQDLASGAGIALQLAQGTGLAIDIEPAADPQPGAGQRRRL
ncbi:hypothetical protein UM91_22045 [Pseudomonas oryzihabitans]|uniref:hypothetical protein n=1 Tax=Pseudomonas oryzihabitans TaxID=47885 RepID=UPI0005C80801|nr:hypothetical protein [Pseudomonas oryzihabitans]KIZ48461.1 hypothetical protein UM91_22045 [Pseudomonas oryzihabitans]